jgi:hypothetical protein
MFSLLRYQLTSYATIANVIIVMAHAGLRLIAVSLQAFNPFPSIHRPHARMPAGFRPAPPPPPRLARDGRCGLPVRCLLAFSSAPPAAASTLLLRAPQRFAGIRRPPACTRERSVAPVACRRSPRACRGRAMPAALAAGAPATRRCSANGGCGGGRGIRAAPRAARRSSDRGPRLRRAQCIVMDSLWILCLIGYYNYTVIITIVFAGMFVRLEKSKVEVTACCVWGEPRSCPPFSITRRRMIIICLWARQGGMPAAAHGGV